MRDLEAWEPEDGDSDGIGGLNMGSANGWKAEDMFKANRSKFGVETSYKDNLEGYTTQLSKDRANSADYRAKEARAERLAREIEGNASSRDAIELENGDEEEAFSAVHRPSPNSSMSSGSSSNRQPHYARGGRGGGGDHHRDHHGHPGNQQQPFRDEAGGGGGNKYVPPAKRQNSTEEGGRGDGGRGPPGGGNPRDVRAGGGPGGDRRSGGGGQPRGTPPPQQQHQQPHHYPPHRDRDHQEGGAGVGRGQHHDDYGRGGGDRRQQQPTQGYQDARYSNDRRSSGNMQQQGYQGRPSPQQQQHKGGNIPQVSASPRDKTSPVPDHHDHKQQQQQQKESTPPGRNQPPMRGPNQQQKIAELKNFQKDFNLAPTTGREASQQQQQQQQQQQPPPQQQEKKIPEASAAEPPMATAEVTGEKGATAASTTAAPGAASPPTPAVKSKLNPNAKEFTLNVNAKAFVPSAPAVARVGGTPPARPITPATPTMMPQQQPGIPPAGHVGYPNFPAGAPMAPQQMLHYAGQPYGGPAAPGFPGAGPQQMGIPQQHAVAGANSGGNPRFGNRGGGGGGGGNYNGPPPPRVSGASDLNHVQAVSGLPLMAPGPGGPQVPAQYIQANPMAMAANNAQVMLRFPGQQFHMVPTSLQQFNVAEGGAGGPSSLPWAPQGQQHQQQPGPPPGAGGQPPPPQQQPQQPPLPTPTPPSGASGNGQGGQTTPSPGPHQHQQQQQQQQQQNQMLYMQQANPQVHAAQLAAAAAAGQQQPQSLPALPANYPFIIPGGNPAAYAHLASMVAAGQGGQPGVVVPHTGPPPQHVSGAPVQMQAPPPHYVTAAGPHMHQHFVPQGKGGDGRIQGENSGLIQLI